MDDKQHDRMSAFQISIIIMLICIVLVLGTIDLHLSRIDTSIRAIPTPNATPITVNVEPAGPAINIYPGPTVETPQWINP